nr:hypothetical protein GCM10010200_076240 [Actinomadura rugatobispora]
MNTGPPAVSGLHQAVPSAAVATLAGMTTAASAVIEASVAGAGAAAMRLVHVLLVLLDMTILCGGGMRRLGRREDGAWKAARGRPHRQPRPLIDE